MDQIATIDFGTSLRGLNTAYNFTGYQVQPTTIQYDVLPISVIWVIVNFAAAAFMIAEMILAFSKSYSTFINHVYSGFDYNTIPADGDDQVLMKFSSWEAVGRPLIKLVLELCIMLAVSESE